MRIDSYLVEFDVNGRTWQERIARPINSKALIAAVRRRKASTSRNLEAPWEYDWSGTIYAGTRYIGRYIIVPASGQSQASDLRAHAGAGDDAAREMGADVDG